MEIGRWQFQLFLYQHIDGTKELDDRNIADTNVSIFISGDSAQPGHSQTSHIRNLVFLSTILHDGDDTACEMTLLQFVWDSLCFLHRLPFFTFQI